MFRTTLLLKVARHQVSFFFKVTRPFGTCYVLQFIRLPNCLHFRQYVGISDLSHYLHPFSACLCFIQLVFSTTAILCFATFPIKSKKSRLVYLPANPQVQKYGRRLEIFRGSQHNPIRNSEEPPRGVASRLYLGLQWVGGGGVGGV